MVGKPLVNIQHMFLRNMFFIKSKCGEVSMEIAFISGMPNPLDVNDGVISMVDFGQCLPECPTVPFLKIMTSVIPKSLR